MKRIIICFFLAAFTTVLYSQEEVIGWSFYDLQTNGSGQNRIYVFDDGTIGAVWTQSHLMYSSYTDRGSGYNYHDGSTWHTWPEERIESQRTGWPSYAPLGVNGELIVSHLSAADTTGLLFSKRNSKGKGDWTESLYTGPSGYETLIWPRMITGGLNHDLILLIALTAPEANGGDPYQGLNGALLYSRSTDGGNTWDIQNQILPGMDSTEYFGFSGDCYAFTEPKENIVAFVIGSYRTDLFLMKSTDYGQTFEKTIIWEHPYPFFDPSITVLVSDTFYSVDGSLSVTLDTDGKAHVVFGIVGNYYDNGWRFNRMVDGVGYWNENRPTFTSNINALNPAGGVGSEMIIDYNLIGWAQDIDGDSAISYIENNIGYMCEGISSMVQLVMDEQNRVFLFFTSVTETYENGMMNYRRLWSRASLNNGETWGQFYHCLADDPTTIFNEYAYPSCATYSDDFVHLLVQVDVEPGIFLRPSENQSENYFQIIKIPKDEIVGINQSNQLNAEFEVSQNFPNPFSESTTIKVNLIKPGNLKLDVFNLVGQKVYEIKSIKGQKGLNSLIINGKELKPGIYFYSVKVDESSVTKKMIVE